jgi:mono/diheme cytochrome c family protein
MTYFKKILRTIHRAFIRNRVRLKIYGHPPLFKIPPRPPLAKGGRGDLNAIALMVGFVYLFLAPSGCDYARMYDQESVRTYKKEIPEMPPEAIPTAGGFQILNSADPKSLKNPLPYTKEAVDQGKEAYFYFCVQCHGPKADGNGTVGQSFAPLPANLTESAVQGQSDGELFSKISLGFGRHPFLASTVSEADRWAVVNYIRSLKKETPKG